MDGYSVVMRHERFKGDTPHAVIKHAGRSVEEENGIFRTHSNENIDSSRTHHNSVHVYDGDGGFREAESIEEIEEYRQSLLAQRKDKRKLRKDQVTHMETLLQLDPMFTGSSEQFINDDLGTAADSSKYIEEVLLPHVIDKIGMERINYIALHLDEKSPHVHIGWTPIADDGSLDFRKVIGETRQMKDGRIRGVLTPKMLSDQHKEIRELLQDNGYPAVEVYSSPKHEKHEVYKRQQKELNVAFAEREGKVKTSEDEADLRERRITRRENKYATDKQQLDNDRATLDNERAAFEEQKQEQQRAHEAEQQRLDEVARQQREDFEKREKELKDKKAADQQQLENDRATMLSEVNDERDTKLSEVQEREDSVGQREQAVSERENEQKRLRKVINSFMASRYYQNAKKHPMDVSRDQAAFVKEVGELYQDIRPTGLESTHNTPSDRARSRSEATTTRAKPRTPTKRAKAPETDKQGQSEGDAPDV